MKKLIATALLLGAITTAQADGLFGAALKPKPNVTLFGQTITWPIPSLCVGAKAGVLPEAGLSSDGLNFKLPWLAIDLPFPTFTLKAGTNVVELKLGEINKSKQE